MSKLSNLKGFKTLTREQQAIVNGGDWATDSCEYILSLPPGGLITEGLRMVCENAAEN